MDDRQTVMTLRELPLALWLVGAAIVIPGLVIFLLNPRGSLFLPVVEVMIALCFFLFPRILTITADLGSQTLTLRYRALLWASERQVNIPEISAIRLEANSDSDSSTTYRIAIVCKDGQVIPLHSYYSSGRIGKQKKVDQLSSFLGLGDPAESGLSALAAGSLAISEPSSTDTTGMEQTTDGIHWTLQNQSAAGSAALRWFSPDFKFPAGFLFLAQKVTGQKAFGGKLVEGIGKFLFQQAIKLYGFAEEDTPGLDRAEMLSPLDGRLEPYFMALTSDPAAARQVLNPWVATPLAEWAERSPLKSVQVQAELGQLVLLFSPRGVYLAHLGSMLPEAVQPLADLGVSVLKAVR
jgi:hypothetical protein